MIQVTPVVFISVVVVVNLVKVIVIIVNLVSDNGIARTKKE